MTYATILTILRTETGAAELLSNAASLARKFDAHLDVICIGIDQIQVGYYFAGADAVVQQTTLAQARDDAEALARVAESLMANEGIRHTVRGVVSQYGVLPEVIAQFARFADLVVLPKPYGASESKDDESILEASLFAGQAPVLVLPENGLPDNFAERAVIGWNEGTEALDAVRAALPALQECDLVSVAVVDPPVHAPDQTGPGHALSTFLDRHGVKAEVNTLAKELPRISDILLAHARDRNATLLVAGAYGHSRFRQAILGGATRELLQQADIPLLMAH